MTWVEAFSAAEVRDSKLKCATEMLKFIQNLLQAVAEKTKLLPTYCIAVTILPVIAVRFFFIEKSMNFDEINFDFYYC